MKNKIVGTKIGNVVNLVIDGNAFQKTFQTQEEANDFYRLMHNARNGDKTALEALMCELNRRYRTVIKGILEKDDADNYYLKGIDIKMPELLANTFVDYLDNEFPVNALVNFWKLLVTNPDPRVRNDLFVFLQNYSFAITDNGYFIAYKAVEVKTESVDDDLAAFVSNQYLKIKKQKKNPSNYNIIKVTTTESHDEPNPDHENDDFDEDDELETITVTTVSTELKLSHVDAKNEDLEFVVLGNLAQLFKDIDKLVDQRTIYQSKHTGENGKIEQVLGVPVKMDRKETNIDPKIECSSGLHVGSVKYVEQFASSGDRILLTLVNPAHVVAVPEYDNTKLRTCEYFPYAELERLKDGKFEVIEEPYFEEDYMKYEAADLEAQIEQIQTAIESVEKPSQVQLDYKKILEDRLVSIEKALAYER